MDRIVSPLHSLPPKHIYALISDVTVFGVRVHKEVAASAKSLQSCLTLCDPIDSSPPSSPIPGIFQARILEWFHFLLQCMKVKSESEVA